MLREIQERHQFVPLFWLTPSHHLCAHAWGIQVRFGGGEQLRVYLLYSPQLDTLVKFNW